MPSYTQYKRQVAVVDANEADIESWITVKGNHIPIMKGQSKEEAVKAFIEKKGDKEKGGDYVSAGREQAKREAGHEFKKRSGVGLSFTEVPKGQTSVKRSESKEESKRAYYARWSAGQEPHTLKTEQIEKDLNAYRQMRTSKPDDNELLDKIHDLSDELNLRKNKEQTKSNKTIRGKTRFGNHIGKLLTAIGSVETPASIIVHTQGGSDKKFDWSSIKEAIKYAESVDDVTGIKALDKDGNKLGWFGIEPANADGDVFDVIYDYTDNDFGDKVFKKLENPESKYDPEFEVVRKNALANSSLYGGRYTQKSKAEAYKAYKNDKIDSMRKDAEKIEKKKKAPKVNYVDKKAWNSPASDPWKSLYDSADSKNKWSGRWKK
jgi:hypothetical protein